MNSEGCSHRFFGVPCGRSWHISLLPKVQGLPARAESEYPVRPWVLWNALHSPESIQDHIVHSHCVKVSSGRTRKARTSGSGLHF